MVPKQTFLNLSKDKQELLIHAAKKEFSRVPLYEASISNIIKDAGIPRGSFYQYFDDKEDVFFFLLDEYSKRSYEIFISIIKKNNGDLFATFIEWFESILINFEEPENRNYFKNAFLNMNYKVEKTFTQNMYEERLKSRFFEIINLINAQKLNITDEKEIFHIMKIMMAVTFQNLVHVFARDLSIEYALNTFSLEINLLKKGLNKEEAK